MNMGGNTLPGFGHWSPGTTYTCLTSEKSTTELRNVTNNNDRSSQRTDEFQCAQLAPVPTDKPKAARLTMNARERRRMRILNAALDDLRAVIPYRANHSKRLSKIATLLLARNYILLQTHTLEQMCKFIEQRNLDYKVTSAVCQDLSSTAPFSQTTGFI